jgi:hypothetical protein
MNRVIFFSKNFMCVLMLTKNHEGLFIKYVQFDFWSRTQNTNTKLKWDCEECGRNS